jgi:2-polyprenyl-6-methoxyphenol hydroxylase-like FAD-dependent oxidoreductase
LSTREFQVIVVGGGPVGLGLAVDLGLRGVSCAVVERRHTPQRIPKGQGLTQRTLEHFYFWGIADELRAARLLPPGYPIGGVTAYGDLMSEYWFAPAGREVVRSFYFQDNERLPQYLTEEVLRRRLTDLPIVTCFFGQAATIIEQDNSAARVQLEDGAWLAAEYLVGCDGARSMVREQLGIDRGGADFDQRMVLAVFRSRELHEGLKRFPERTTYRVLRPELKGYWQFFGRVDVGEGWFFHAPVPRSAAPASYDFHALIQQAAGFSFQATFDHVGFWELRIAVATRYRVGRVLIAGDACHSHPPYGGFGLNSGLEDVANLGWKLTARLDGWGGDALLDSYGEERRPIFVETGEAMIAGGIEADRVFLERYSPERDRAEFTHAWQSLETNSRTRQQSYEPHYEGSSIVAGPTGGVCSIFGQHSFAAVAGHHLTPQVLSSGRNVFEELGPGFTLLAFDAAADSFEHAAQRLNIPLTIIRDTYGEDRQAYAARLILVRPDQYVVWTGDSAPSDPAALLRKVTGSV